MVQIISDTPAQQPAETTAPATQAVTMPAKTGCGCNHGAMAPGMMSKTNWKLINVTLSALLIVFILHLIFRA